MTHDPEERGPANSPQKAVPAEPTLHLPTTSEQRTARIMGAWFLGTFLLDPSLLLLRPDPERGNLHRRHDNGTRIGVGALLEILLAVSGIATAVVIYPIVKRVSRSVALGYVASRTVESVLILIGVLSLMMVVALHQNLARHGGAEETLTDVIRCAPSPCTNRPVLLGPQFCAGLPATGSCSAT